MSDSGLIFLQVVALLTLALARPVGVVLTITKFTLPISVYWFAVMGFADACILLILGFSQIGKDSRASPKPDPESKLKTGGVYRICRHPIYTGMMGCGFFWALIVGSYLGIAAAFLLTLVLIFKARREEAYLVELHGQKYLDYHKSVGRFF